ncbi:MAG: NAD(P)H-binding protein [Anaerolineae bacterium]|nr:NAD(P)H-binding protein [Anaerolineae bacterium]
MPAMILVTGSTGFIGRHLVAGLAEAGWPVRVLLPPRRRGPLRLPWPDHTVEVAQGSIHDTTQLQAAMQGVHTVFHLASAQWWGSARDLNRVDVEGTRNVIRAAQAARIGRLVVMSHLGAAPASAYVLLRAKGTMEDLVRNSGLAYTIIRSGIVFGEEDVFVNGVAMVLRSNPFLFLQPGQGESLLHPLYIADLIRGLIGTLDNLETVDRVLEIGGPEYLTFSEMVRTVMRVSHAHRAILPLPPYLVRWLTQFIRRVLPRWPTTPQWFDLLASHRTASLSSLPDVFGFKPRRFEDTLLTYMPGRRYLFQLLRFVVRRGRPHSL